MSDTFADWKNRISWGVLAGGVSLHILWATWMTTEMFRKPNKDEMREYIENSSPYAKDAALIRQSMTQSKEAAKETRRAIDNNTKAIIQLQSFLERREKT